MVEFLLDQRRRRLELVALVELVEQRALELLARRAGVLALDALLDRVAQLVEQFKAERLGELVVDRDLARRLDRLRGHVELGVLAGEIRRR